MPNKTLGIVLMGAGVLFVYLGYTGHLESFWRGVKGDCGGTTTGVSEGTEGTDTQGGTAAGFGGEAFTPLPTGTMALSTSGSWA